MCALWWEDNSFYDLTLLDCFSCGRVSLRPNQRWRQGGRRGLEQGRVGANCLPLLNVVA